jgi:hypothetical protein
MTKTKIILGAWRAMMKSNLGQTLGACARRINPQHDAAVSVVGIAHLPAWALRLDGGVIIYAVRAKA